MTYDNYIQFQDNDKGIITVKNTLFKTILGIIKRHKGYFVFYPKTDSFFNQYTMFEIANFIRGLTNNDRRETKEKGLNTFQPK
jgi:hypothetical protein